MKKILFCFLLLVSATAGAFEIFAIGTSNTNCKNVDREKSFTVTLEKILRQQGIDATVINSGIDGDKPVWMTNRVETAVNNPNVKLVIFEPGPNERYKPYNLKYSAEVLSKLQKAGMPTIYVGHRRIQTDEEARALAQEYGAYYYGRWHDNIPVDRDHFQFDTTGTGHMSEGGCQLWAQHMSVTVKQVVQQLNLR